MAAAAAEHELAARLCIAAARRGWDVFRNRRPDLYGVLLEPTPDRLLTRQAA